MSQTIDLTPSGSIQPIFEATVPAVIDWLSLRFEIASQAIRSSGLFNFERALFQGFASWNIPNEIKNAPQLILYFKKSGSWVEWGRVALYPSDATDWGLIDLKQYFGPRDYPLTLGPGAAIGCKLTYASPSDTIRIIGGVTVNAWGGGSGDTSLPVGMITPYAGETPPPGWLDLNGSHWERASYPALWVFAQNEIANGNAFWHDGDGVTTFGASDCRGEFIRVWDGGRGVDVGRAIGSWQNYQIHDISGSFAVRGNYTIAAASGSFSVVDETSRTSIDISGSSIAKSVFFSPSLMGEETRSRNLALLFIIKF